jgi:PadR family transcriptional regulator, regulatory protein PadR
MNQRVRGGIASCTRAALFADVVSPGLSASVGHGGLDTCRLDAYIVVDMPSFAILGEFEVVVLMAVLHLGDAAYGSAIRDDIERRSGRRVARGAVYITLERLEEKGLLGSELEGASARRGGRPKRLFRVTPAGIRSLKHALALVTRMHRGLEPILGDL